MDTQELFVAAARTCLSTRKKSLSLHQCLNLAAQVCAVNLGLKPALLYDTNSADAEQVQRYVSSLQSSQLVSPLLLILCLNGNTLIVNRASVRSNLEQQLQDKGVVVIDVCHSLDKPAITDPSRAELKGIAEELLSVLRDSERTSEEAERPLYVTEKSDEWNLCTVFGLLLGYPATYWFDQSESFENCLSMTPLAVTTASAIWQVQDAAHECCLYSFSIPANLHEEIRSKLEEWNLRLHERFQQQTVLKNLCISQSMVTLPSVCL